MSSLKAQKKSHEKLSVISEAYNSAQKTNVNGGFQLSQITAVIDYTEFKFQTRWFVKVLAKFFFATQICN